MPRVNHIGRWYYTEPGHLNGTAQAIDRILATGQGGRHDPVEIREAERGFRERLYRDALHDRRLDRLDLAITEGEVALSDEVMERLRRDPASLTAADRLAIARAPLIAPKFIPSEIDALLAANGFALPFGHPDRAALSLAVARARVRAARIEREAGDGAPGDRHAADAAAGTDRSDGGDAGGTRS